MVMMMLLLDGEWLPSVESVHQQQQQQHKAGRVPVCGIRALRVSTDLQYAPGTRTRYAATGHRQMFVLIYCARQRHVLLVSRCTRIASWRDASRDALSSGASLSCPDTQI